MNYAVIILSQILIYGCVLNCVSYRSFVRCLFFRLCLAPLFHTLILLLFLVRSPKSRTLVEVLRMCVCVCVCVCCDSQLPILSSHWNIMDANCAVFIHVFVTLLWFCTIDYLHLVWSSIDFSYTWRKNRRRKKRKENSPAKLFIHQTYSNQFWSLANVLCIWMNVLHSLLWESL